MEQTHTVQYGPPGRYFVREEVTQRAVYSGDSKSEVIAEAEKRNGWPVTGSEAGYADSQQKAMTGSPLPADPDSPPAHEGNAVALGEAVRATVGEPIAAGRAFNDPVVDCCGRDAADCDCPPTGIAGDQPEGAYVMTVSCYVERNARWSAAAANDRLMSDAECREYVERMRERVCSEFGIDLVVPDEG